MVVTVNRFAQPVSSVLASSTVVTKDEIELWQSKNLVEVMHRLPVVDIAQNGGVGQSDSLYVRGSEARHTLVLVDGIPLAKPGITGVADFNQIPISLAQRVEFIRGPRSAVYGDDAIGGVINIITQTYDDNASISADAGSDRYQEFSGNFTKNVTKDTRITVTGSFQETVGYNIKPNSTWPADSDRDGWNNKAFWAGIDHTFNQNFSAFFRGYGYGAGTDYDAGSFGGQDAQQVYNHSYDAGLRFNRGDYASQLIASYQKYKALNYVTAEGRYADRASLDDMKQRTLQWGNTLRLGQGMVTAGMDWKHQRLLSVGQSFSTSARESDRYQQNNSGAYLTTQQQLGTVTLEGSVRGDDNEDFGRHGTWQAAAAWEFFSFYKLTFSYGTGFESPTLGQLHGQKRFDIASNPNLKPEESGQWEADLDGVSEPLTWRLAAWHNQVENMIDYASNPVTFQGGILQREISNDEGC